MKYKYIPFSFGIFYLILGYFSWTAVMQNYVSGHKGIIADMHTYFVAPLFTAFFSFLFYVLTWKIFRKITIFNNSQEVIFQSLYLLANAMIFSVITRLVIFKYRDELSNVQLLNMDSHFFITVYLISAIVSLLLFVGIRRKWR